MQEKDLVEEKVLRGRVHSVTYGQLTRCAQQLFRLKAICQGDGEVMGFRSCANQGLTLVASESNSRSLLGDFWGTGVTWTVHDRAKMVERTALFSL